MASPTHPPGATEEVRARSALVLAPHYDDEVLGCGGLVVQLAASRADVRILFLTDSSGGPEGSGGDADYPERRRAEAEAACAVLGVEDLAHLGFVDGALATAVEPLAQRLEEELAEREPELVLVTSPLEVTLDHRAAFAALHRALTGESLGGKLRNGWKPRILAYEVNHPLYPDVLVDTTDQMPTVERAMACYESQLERHGYLRGLQGLRSFRIHSLPPEVEAAEAYRSLTAADFTSRSLSALIEELGGAAPRLELSERGRVSLVVRTFDRPALLREALGSVAACRYHDLQVVVVNDGGEPPELDPDAHPFALEVVDLEENRGRGAAANAGLAAVDGDLVGFLDDDDLLYPEHLMTLTGALAAPGVSVAYSDAAVAVYELEGGDLESDGGWRCVERRVPYSRDFDPDLLRFDNYIPFHTVLWKRRLLERAGTVDEDLPFFEDWDFLLRLAAETPFHHVARVTCEYRHFRQGGHHVLGRAGVAEEERFREVKAQILRRHGALANPRRLADVVARLRREAVELGESLGLERSALATERAGRHADRAAHGLETAALRRRAEELEAERGRVQDALHELRGEHQSLGAEQQRLGDLHHQLEASHRDLRHELERAHGELHSLRRDRERLHEELQRSAVEVQRLSDEGRERHRVIESQTEDLRRLYGEVERLTELIEQMEGTRAWRLHQLLQRKRA